MYINNVLLFNYIIPHISSYPIKILDQILLRVMALSWEIIVYSRSTINVYSLLSHEWWVPLIKFIVGPTIYVRGGSMHL